MSKLFSPITIKKVTLRNRITVSPMCMYSSDQGFTNQWHMIHLGSRAIGGAGLIIAEATAVSPEGRITPHDLGIWSDDHVEGLHEITSFLAEQGTVAGIQLAHAGRKASTSSPWTGGRVVPPDEGGWEPVAPSPLPFREGDPKPNALEAEGIEKVKADFKTAAKRAADAGFKVAEIHAAHGYLIHEFLSPLSNQRTDTYGGSFENRTRLLLEVIEEVQKVWPQDNPLFVRISATDWVEGGWTAEDSIALAGKLKETGVDLVDCSTGGNTSNFNVRPKPNYQVDFAERIKKETGILTAAVGLITEAAQAEEIVAKEQADLVFIGREHLRNPYFALHAAQELGVDISWPVQYERAKPR